MPEFKKISVQDDDQGVVMAKPETSGYGDPSSPLFTPPLVPVPVAIRDLKVTPLDQPKIQLGLVRDTIMCCW
jgi:hypothetical protein